MITYEQLQHMVEELETAAFAVLDASDREYVSGVKMLIHMQEPVSPEVAMRVQKIYTEFKNMMHEAMKTKG